MTSYSESNATGEDINCAGPLEVMLPKGFYTVGRRGHEEEAVAAE